MHSLLSKPLLFFVKTWVSVASFLPEGPCLVLGAHRLCIERWSRQDMVELWVEIQELVEMVAAPYYHPFLPKLRELGTGELGAQAYQAQLAEACRI